MKQMDKVVRVLSFGAGVQSSALLLLKHIQANVKTRIYRAQAKFGRNIVDEVQGHWKGEIKRCGQPPLFTKDKAGGMLSRHCTKEYKIEVVDQKIREVLGYGFRQKMRHKIDLLMGISADEMQRMRISQQAWKRNLYPLVDLNLRREDCVRYVEKLGLGTPPRSACYFCPYKTNKEWKLLKEQAPDDWDKAVEFDRAIRTSASPKLTSEFFVHSSRVPLDQADLQDYDSGQLSMLDECEGICGV